MSDRDYFLSLAGYGSDLLGRLPIELEPQPLDYALGRLAPLLEQMRPSETEALRRIARSAPNPGPGPTEGNGLNTVGMLSDRFTILLIKEWCLRHKGGRDPAKADALFSEQTLDIVAALTRARPGTSATNSKITRLKSGAKAEDWPEAFYGLLTTNLLMWESQEMLYIKDISASTGEELRAYIKWFSFSNILRNEYIEYCEKFYWDTSR